MTQYNSLNIKLSNLQLNKLKSSIKNGTDVNNIWAADLADMQLISKFNKGFRFLL